MPIKFIDLETQRRRLEPGLSTAIQSVVESGAYILGAPVTELERALSEFAAVGHTVTCANGTDALHLVLRAWDIGPGDLVAVPAFTFAASAEAPILAGGAPVFVDVLPDTFNLDPDSLRRAIDADRAGARRLKAVIAVDLFGQPAAYEQIQDTCRQHGLKLLADIAQSFGAKHHGRHAAALGDAAATSFYPSKPLGCYGDGGAVFTNDGALADRLRSLRNHGAGASRYDHVAVGLNSRLDSIQAAVLLEKLKILPEELELREAIAERYRAGLHNVVTTPKVAPQSESAWAHYTVLSKDRDRLQAALKSAEIPSVVYYPVPLHSQPAFRGAAIAPGGCPVSEDLARTVLSLPMHPYLETADQEKIIEVVTKHTRDGG